MIGAAAPLARRRTPRRPHETVRRASLAVEHRRLLRAFTLILAAAAPASLAAACGQAGAPRSSPGADAGPDAHTDAQADVQTDVQDDTVDAESDGDADMPDCAVAIAEIDAGADGPMNCTYALPCGLPGGLNVVGCAVYSNGIPLGCDVPTDSGCLADAYVVVPGAPVTLECPGCLGGSGGRRPRGLRPLRAVCGPTAEGAYFARMAHEEAASIHAFEQMAGELAAHGAPAALQRAAARAVRDEQRHARFMAKRARALGAPVPVPRVRRGALRALEPMAHENAVEGCVNETFGALIAAFQAEHAPRASLRRAFARIAADEARHAALSWAVARWAEARLDPAARARVAAARARAVGALRRQMGTSPFDVAVGMPGSALRARMLDGMIQELQLGKDDA